MARRVLVAYDESPQAANALRHALSRYPDADVTVLHVNDPLEWVHGDEMGGFYSEEAYDRARRSAEELLTVAEDIAGEYDTEVSTETETGRVANTIVNVAEANDFDHIVLGSHGRGAISRFLLGSVAETVIRRAPISVTVIREDEPDSKGIRA